MIETSGGERRHAHAVGRGVPVRESQEALARAADRVSFLIVCTDVPAVDVSIERSKVRELCEALFPDRLALFDLVYEARWDRLWDQFRESEAGATYSGAAPDPGYTG